MASGVSDTEEPTSTEFDFMAVDFRRQPSTQEDDVVNTGTQDLKGDKVNSVINIPMVQALDGMYSDSTVEETSAIKLENDNSQLATVREDNVGDASQTAIEGQQANKHASITPRLETSKERAPIPRFAKPQKYGARRISEHLHANRAEGMIYGQWEEREVLVNILKRSSRQAKVDFVLISGALGVGKTVLARTLKNPLVLKDDGTPDVNTRPCFFLEAKFEHLRSPSPYQIFLDIFQDFTEQVMVHPELNKYRMLLWEAVHEDMDLVVNLIPSFRNMLSSTSCDMDSSQTSSSDGQQNTTPAGALMAQRVTTLFVTLLQTIASVTPQHPLVVCLDDLHWASETSLDTLVCLIKDMDVNAAGSVIFVANRRNCIAGNCPFCPWQQSLRSCETVQVHSIKMQNLIEIDVVHILRDTIMSQCQSIKTIGSLIYSLTEGNPMFITEVLRTLQEEGLVYENQESRMWAANIPAIEASLAGLTNVFDLISQKLKKLPPCTFRALMRASCLGASQIDESILQLLEPLNAKKCLEKTVEAGYLREEGDGNYRFVSDGVQYCIYHLLPEQERAAFHLEIAQVLWSHLEERKDKEFLYLLLNQLMLGDSLLKADEDRLAVATLCLRAGESCAKKLGFQTAWVYLKHGISLLPKDNPWGRQSYDLCLRLHNTAIEVCYCNAEFDLLEELIVAILKNSRVFEDQLLARTTQIYALGSRNRLPEAIESALATLKELGEVIPANPSTSMVRSSFHKTRRMLGGLSDEYILRMEPMKNKISLGKMQILNHMFLYCYYSRPNLAAIVATRMVQITRTCGACAISSVAFSFYSQFLCSCYSVKDGLRFGKLSLKLYEKYGNEAWLSRVWSFYYGAVSSWKEPLASTHAPLQHGFKVGLRTGDIEYALLNGSYFCWNNVEMLPLPQLKKEIQKIVSAMETTGHTMALAMLKPILNFVLNFTDNPAANRREEFLDVVEKETQTALESSNKAVLLWFRVSTLMSAYYYGDLELAERNLNGIRHLYETHKYCGIGATVVLFFECMTVLALSHNKGLARRLRDIAYVQKRVKQLETWADDAPENLLDKLHLLKAELAVVRGNHRKASQHYRSGILHAQSEGRLSLAGLGKERFAIYLAKRGDKGKAAGLLEEAGEIYEKWGAIAKVDKLKFRIRHLLAGQSSASDGIPSTHSHSSIHSSEAAPK